MYSPHPQNNRHPKTGSYKGQFNDFYQEKFLPTPRSARSAAGESDFQSLFELAANKLGVGTEMTAIRICHQAGQVLSKLFPDQSNNFKVISYKTGVLIISASSAPARQRLFTKQHLLQKELNQALKTPKIQKIIIRTG